MTSKEFKKTGRILRELYKELEAEAIGNGVDIFGDEYQELQARVRLALLQKMGYTLEEYVEARDRTVNEQKAQRKAEIDDVYRNLVEVERKAEDKIVEEDVLRMIDENQKPPQIIEKTINQIVERTTVEKPTIIEKTETIVEREEYDDSELREALESIVERLEAMPKPEPFDREGMMEEVRNVFGELFEHNINILGMPNFRKLAMGLQDQVDKAAAGIGNTITVSGDYSVKPSDQTVVLTAVGNVTLPAGVLGKTFNIKNLSSGVITITAPSNIDDETSQSLDPYDNMHLQFTGDQYIII